jgi:hypothetical protein
VKDPGPKTKPAPEEARRILLALADNAATSRCAFNGDVVQSLLGRSK